MHMYARTVHLSPGVVDLMQSSSCILFRLVHYPVQELKCSCSWHEMLGELVVSCELVVMALALVRMVVLLLAKHCRYLVFWSYHQEEYECYGIGNQAPQLRQADGEVYNKHTAKVTKGVLSCNKCLFLNSDPGGSRTWSPQRHAGCDVNTVGCHLFAAS